jgi:hypothetical protein
MKNIYLIPTDKTSRLIQKRITGELKLSSLNNPQLWNNINICITSDEKPKKGDWGIRKNGEFWKFTDGDLTVHFNIPENSALKGKKIILTDNKELINDGVQAIDDEFLQWFVKNPSCEEVEVIKQKLNTDYRSDWKEKFYYKIIIPKEEPKQETLEEAAERHWKMQYIMALDESTKPYIIQDFIAGAEWKAKRMYSEDEVRNIATKFFYHWYNAKGNNTEQGFDSWFEQFKKK